MSEDLDVMYGEDERIGDSLYALTRALDVHPEVVARVGPGGGWPSYRFHGTRRDLTILYRRYYRVGDHPGNVMDFHQAVANLEQAEPSLL